MNFAHPFFLLLLLLLPLLAWLKGKRGAPPAFLYSSVKLVEGRPAHGVHVPGFSSLRCAGWRWPSSSSGSLNRV